MTEMPTTLQIPLVFALGAIVGSFLNVVVWRLPRNESVVRPGSHCPSCGNPIPLRWNIPLLSWLLLRGRCRNCEAAISVRYPLVELATALLFVALLLQLGPGLRLLAGWMVGSILIAAAYIDGQHKIIPNELTLPAIPVGLALAWFAPPPGLLEAAAGALLVGGLLWGIATGYERLTGRIGLGMGDVKLMIMLGCFLGLEPTLAVLVMGSLLGIAQAGLVVAFRGGGRLTTIPFGPALSAAGLFHLVAPSTVAQLFQWF
ncbi:MAG: prepilin peptidase [Myxococcales bacterium]|nr:prepilin peptidase [Myxococcales bacterium]